MSPQKRRLEDLYVVGKDISFDDGKGAPVTVWLRKLNPIESTTAVRRANAERSKVRSAKHVKDSDLYREVYFEVLEFGDDPDGLVDYLALDEMANITLQTEAKLELEEEWSKEEYLQGLRDAWEASLRDRYTTDPDDAEARRVFSELQRFADAAGAMAEEEYELVKARLRRSTLEELRDKAIEQMLRYRSSSAWLDEFHRCEIWLGTFEEDRATQYWPQREQIDKLPSEILTKLLSEYQELSVDVLEGKDSEVTPDSSSSSEPPDEAETVASSGLAVVSQ
jgi:hypothetical protein